MRAALGGVPGGRGRGDHERSAARAPDAPRRAILGLVPAGGGHAAHGANRRKAVAGSLPRSSSASAGTARPAAAAETWRARALVATAKRDSSRGGAARGVPPVLAAFCDLDARVRYYACEAMYNIVKTARGGLLLLTECRGDDFFYDENGNVSADSDSFLRRLFDAACDLSADADADVQNAAHLLDGLVKDVVSEAFPDAEDDARSGDVLRSAGDLSRPCPPR